MFFFFLQIRVIVNDSGIISVLDNLIIIFVQLLDIDDQEFEFFRRLDMESYIFGFVLEEYFMEYCGIVDVVIDRDSYVNNSFIFYYIIGKRVKMGRLWFFVLVYV